MDNNSSLNKPNGFSNKRFCPDSRINKAIPPSFANNNDDDDIWDEIDISAVEDCMQKEAEVLSQFPLSTQRTTTPKKPKINDSNNINFLNKGTSSSSHIRPNNIFLNNKFNDFAEIKKGFQPRTSTQICQVKPQPNINNQLVNLKKEKEDLEEELQIKRGEVSNLRNELMRKENVIETQRIDNCAAIEAAEKRGKDKVRKTVTELEAKLATLKKDLEKCQGEAIFKNKEVEELIFRCRHLEQQSSPTSKRPILSSQKVVAAGSRNSSKADKFSPAKGPSKISPGKGNFNFNDRFDFRSPKTSPKVHLIDAQCQTEEKKSHNIVRQRLNIINKRGRLPISRKSSMTFSSSLKDERKPSLSPSEGVYLPSLYSSLLCLRMPESSLLEQSESISTESAANLVSKACEKLKEIRESFKPTQTVAHNRTIPWVKDGLKAMQWYNQSCLIHIKGVAIFPCRGDALSEAIGEIIAHLEPLDYEGEVINKDMFEDCLQCLSLLGTRVDSSLPKALCTSVISSLKSFFLRSPPADERKITGLCLALISFSSVDNFRLQLCQEASEDCFLSPFCNFITINSASSDYDSLELCQNVIKWVSVLFIRPPFWLSKSRCSCSLHLLTCLITLLDRLKTPFISDESVCVLTTGVRLLHRWQLIDASWWEKVAPLSEYISFISAFSHMAPTLKKKGLLDHSTWELLYDLYDIEDTS